MANIIAVTMNKGGVGKTSLVTNLAAAISSTQPEKRILIVDADAQGNAAIAFGRKPAEFKRTIHDVFVDGAAINDVKVKITEKLDLVPANKEMDVIDFEILMDRESFPKPLSILKPAIDAIKGEYDYILIDCPPSLSLITGNVLMVSDRVIIPFMPESYAVNGLVRVVESVQEFRKKNNPNLSIAGIVGMIVDMRTTLHQEMIQKARQYCSDRELRMYETMIPRSIRFASSTAYEGKPAVWTDKSNPIVAGYFELLEEVMESVK